MQHLGSLSFHFVFVVASRSSYYDMLDETFMKLFNVLIGNEVHGPITFLFLGNNKVSVCMAFKQRKYGYPGFDDLLLSSKIQSSVSILAFEDQCLQYWWINRCLVFYIKCICSHLTFFPF